MKKIAKNYFAKIMLAFAFVLAVSFAHGTDVNAAGSISGLHQTYAYKSNIEVSWNAVVGNNVRYQVQVSTTSTFQNYSVNSTIGTSSTSGYVYNLSAGSRYYCRVIAYQNNVGGTVLAQSPTIMVATRPEDNSSYKVSHTSSGTTSVAVAWSKVTGANQYLVQYQVSGTSNFATAGTVTGNSFNIKGLKKNTYYRVAVTPQVNSGSGFVASGTTMYLGSIPTLPTKITGLKADTVQKKYAYFKYDGISTADGIQYRICYGTKKGKDQFLKGTKSYASGSFSVENSKINSQKFYYVQVRAFVTNSSNKNVYGAWSNKVYFSKISTDSQVTISKKNGKMKVSWKKVSGASGYYVYVATKYDGKYKKVATVKKQNTTSAVTSLKLKNKTNYYVRVVPYKKVEKKNVSATYSKSSYSEYVYWANGKFY